MKTWARKRKGEIRELNKEKGWLGVKERVLEGAGGRGRGGSRSW